MPVYALLLARHQPQSRVISSRFRRLQRSTPAFLSVSDDAGKGGHFRSGNMSPTQSSGAKAIVGQLSSPASPAPSTLKVSRMASGPPATGGGVPAKKKRIRASKKLRTQSVQVESGDFRDLVLSLTGGTYCSQATATASPIVSSAPSISRNPTEPSSSAAESYLVRPQTSRLSANCSPGDAGSAGAEVPVVPPTASALPVAHELPALLECMQLQSDEGGLNVMMGYTNQSSWSAMDFPFLTTESVGVSVSSQYSGLFTSDVMAASSSVYSRGSMPFLRVESELSKDGNPYQPGASLDTVCSEGAHLQRHYPEEDYDVDSWIDY